MTVEYHPAVERELREILDFYESRVPGLGREFIDEFERQILRIAATPGSMDGAYWRPASGSDAAISLSYLFPATRSKPGAYHDCKTSAPTSSLWTRSPIVLW
jgi:hypothetical protein